MDNADVVGCVLAFLVNDIDGSMYKTLCFTNKLVCSCIKRLIPDADEKLADNYQTILKKYKITTPEFFNPLTTSSVLRSFARHSYNHHISTVNDFPVIDANRYLFNVFSQRLVTDFEENVVKFMEKLCDDGEYALWKEMFDKGVLYTLEYNTFHTLALNCTGSHYYQVISKHPLTVEMVVGGKLPDVDTKLLDTISVSKYSNYPYKELFELDFMQKANRRQYLWNKNVSIDVFEELINQTLKSRSMVRNSILISLMKVKYDIPDCKLLILDEYIACGEKISNIRNVPYKSKLFEVLRGMSLEVFGICQIGWKDVTDGMMNNPEIRKHILSNPYLNDKN